jgi:hypothetical protein
MALLSIMDESEFSATLQGKSTPRTGEWKHHSLKCKYFGGKKLQQLNNKDMCREWIMRSL